MLLQWDFLFYNLKVWPQNEIYTWCDLVSRTFFFFWCVKRITITKELSIVTGKNANYIVMLPIKCCMDFQRCVMEFSLIKYENYYIIFIMFPLLFTHSLYQKWLVCLHISSKHIYLTYLHILLTPSLSLPKPQLL